MAEEITRLQSRISRLEIQLHEAKKQLEDLQNSSRAEEKEWFDDENGIKAYEPISEQSPKSLPLRLEEYKRYGRQLIMPEIGVNGQRRLKSGSVLIIGAGGLGCPAAAYLAGAGVGHIGVVDGDLVEESNLHRQVLHTTKGIGQFKAESVRQYVKSLNPFVECVAICENLSTENVADILPNYDLTLDCTDTPNSRYLISDAAILLGKPIVFASALRTEGQMIVLNNPVGLQGDEDGGPCYRCIFPNCPPVEATPTCGEGGILGPVVGVMGILQALEAIKILACNGQGSVEKESLDNNVKSNTTTMTMFSAYSNPAFRTLKMRKRRKGCKACSKGAILNLSSFTSLHQPHAHFCHGISSPSILSHEERVHPEQLAVELRTAKERPLIVDVREKSHFDVFHLENSVNIPFSEVMEWRDERDWMTKYTKLKNRNPMYVLCRLGNDSQLAVQKFKAFGMDLDGQRYIGDVEGGWYAWRKKVAGHWPEF